MAILTDPPEWRVPGTKPPRNIIEELGWEVASHPPAPWFNWFFHRVFESLLELESATLARVVNEAGVPGIMAGPESDRPDSTPETVGRIYIATDTKRVFRDRGNGWDLLNTPEAIGAETPAGAQAKADASAGAALSAAKAYADGAVAAHAGRTDNPHQVTAAQLGLGDVLTHLAQILDSRIVDHNLDVPNPPNGWYVRWENGLQVVFGEATFDTISLSASGSVYASPDLIVTLPAAFSTEVYAWHVNADEFLGNSWVGLGWGAQDDRGSIKFRIYSGIAVSGQNVVVSFFAIGRWKS